MAYLSSLISKKKLDRDKGLDIIKEILRDRRDEDISMLEVNVLGLLAPENDWESIHGGLCASALMIQGGVSSDNFCTEVQVVLPGMLDHTEARVRLSTGKKHS